MKRIIFIGKLGKSTAVAEGSSSTLNQVVLAGAHQERMPPSLARRLYPESQPADKESLAMFVNDSLRPPQFEELPKALPPQSSKVRSSIAIFRATPAKTY